MTCAIHGPMHRRFDMSWWDCVGFDGERCNALLTDEQLLEIDSGFSPLDLLTIIHGAAMSWKPAWRRRKNGTSYLHVEVVPGPCYATSAELGDR